VVTYGAEAWTLNKDTIKRLSVFKRKVLRRIFGGIKVNENWRKQYNKELIQLFGDLDILSFVKISRMKWIGHVNRMDSKRKVSQLFNNKPQGHQLRGRPKNRWWNCV
jgi:intein/homing endonuclease